MVFVEILYGTPVRACLLVRALAPCSGAPRRAFVPGLSLGRACGTVPKPYTRALIL